MTEYVVHAGPTLLDLLVVCSKLPRDSIDQYEAFTGRTFFAEDVAAMHFQRPRSWVLTADNEPIAAGGYDQLRPGVYQDWLLATEAAFSPAHWKATSRRCKRVMDAMLRTDAHRLQCVALASRVQAINWYRVLGLELEGTLRGYGVNGEDALMFSRLRAPDGNG